MFSKRGFLVVGLVLTCVCGTAFCTGKDQGKPDPFMGTSVLVEAFMVRVSTEGLIKSGVNPISNAPEGISILNILWCLTNPDYAEVRSGVKALASHRDESVTSKSGTVYIKSTYNSRGTSSVKYNSYKINNVLEVRPMISSMGNVKLYVQYSNTDIVKNEDSAGPPTMNSFSWQGAITAKSGVGVIVSAVQSDEKNITFLILTATIQGQQETKKKK